MRFPALALFTALLLSAPALADEMGGMSMPMAQAQKPTGPVAKSFAAANDKMMKDMSVPLTEDADRDFVTSMIPHHQGAIDMARIELAHGKDAKLRKLAQDIVAAQEKEIAFMKAWLAAHPK